MNGAEKIREKIVELGIMDRGEANACRIQYGYEYSTCDWGRGWHLQRFGRSEVSFLGSNITEALDGIDIWAEELEIVS